MGLRGPKAKPLALRVLEGNPSGRPLNHAAPQPKGKAKCPKHLRPEARERWNRIVKSMPPGFYTAADEALLAAYCEAWADHKMATEEITATPLLVTAEGRMNPVLVIRNRAAQTMATLAGRLGLSPSDRTGLKSDTAATGSKWDGLTK